MPTPRIFISSTCYDLKEQRYAIENAFSDMGYEVRLSEKGDVTYEKNQGLEESCYSEVSQCDIVVGIIGGKFGSQSQKKDNVLSITMNEIKRALDEKRLVYVFVLDSVNNEYKTYQRNREKTDIEYAQVDSIKIYEFLDNIYRLVPQIPIFPFVSSSDIIDILKKQFAGALCKYIQNDNRISQENTAISINQSVLNLQNAISVLNKEINEIGLRNKGILTYLLSPMARLKEVLNFDKFTVFVNTFEGLCNFLQFLDFSQSKHSDNDYIFVREKEDKIEYMIISKALFDESNNMLNIPYDDCKDKIRYTLKLAKKMRQSSFVPF